MDGSQAYTPSTDNATDKVGSHSKIRFIKKETVRFVQEKRTTN